MNIQIRNMAMPIMAFIFLNLGCQQNRQGQSSAPDASDTVSSTTAISDEVDTWYEEKGWLGETRLIPDPSIDRHELYIRYHEHPDRWKKAFAFLTSGKLDTIQAGVHELDGQNVFVKVTEYQTVSSDKKDYESHNEYTDIQYVLSGVEYIGFRDKNELTIKTPYSAEKDIMFYNEKDEQNLLARPGTFFIFFPHNAHRMSLAVKESSPVKKIVIKVRND